MLWATAKRLGYTEYIGAILGLLFGLCTIAWPYANHFFGEPLSTFALLLCFYGILSWQKTKQYKHLWFAGIGAALAIAQEVEKLGTIGFARDMCTNSGRSASVVEVSISPA